MKITTQDGRVIEAHDIEISGCEIKCTPVNDMRKRELCGAYKDRIRATAIFAEMTCIGWNNKNPEYVMPETVIYNTMADTQRKIYTAHLAQAKKEMEEELQAKGAGRSHIKMLALLTRLRQLCCHPSLYLQDYNEESGKLVQCMELVRDSVAAGHKILIFSQFTTMLDLEGIRSMLIRNLKVFSDSRFPISGEIIKCYEIKECFDITYFLCQYNDLFIPLKKSDVELIEEKKNGQLSLF